MMKYEVAVSSNVQLPNENEPLIWGFLLIMIVVPMVFKTLTMKPIAYKQIELNTVASIVFTIAMSTILVPVAKFLAA